MDGAADQPPRRLDDIHTDWNRVSNANQFILWYSTAIRAYIHALLRDPAEADEVVQQVMLKIVERGFGSAEPTTGRFRDYLKATLRNAARTHLRRKAAGPPVAHADLDEVAGNRVDADRAWVDEWRRCLLARVWDALAAHERRVPGNLAGTILRLYLDHPDEDSDELARRVAGVAGEPLRAAAFRQRLSRARRLFAELLMGEVAATLGTRDRPQVVDELASLGLLHYVREYLPPDA